MASNSKTYEAPLVSLIVINYNGKSKLGSLLDKCLSSLLNTDYANFEILFVDNNSTDDSVEYVMKKFNDPRIRIIRLEKNYGYAGAVNRALKHAKGEFIAVLNNDVIVNKDWLKHIITFLSSNCSVN